MLLIFSTVLVVSCSRQSDTGAELLGDDALESSQPSNTLRQCSDHLHFNWLEIIPSPYNQNLLIPNLLLNKDSTKCATEYEILLPNGKTIEDYVMTIINNLDKTSKVNTPIEDQLKQLFRKSAFELGIESSIIKITIEKDLAELEDILQNFFTIKEGKLENIGDASNTVEADSNLGKHLFNSLIGTAEPAFEVHVYLPNNQEVEAFVKNCYNEAKTAKLKPNILREDGKVSGALLMNQILLKLASIQESNTEKCKWSDVLAKFRECDCDNFDLVGKNFSDNFQLFHVWNNQPIDSSPKNHFRRLYVTFSDLITLKREEAFAFSTFLSKINRFSSITGKDESEIFSKLISTALSANSAQKHILKIDTDNRGKYIGYEIKKGEIAQLKTYINTALFTEKLPELTQKTKSAVKNSAEKIIPSSSDDKNYDLEPVYFPSYGAFQRKENTKSKFSISGLKAGLAVVVAAGVIGAGLWYFSK